MPQRTATRMSATNSVFPNQVALLRLLQLVSPALPVGAYAYSQGLEQAVVRGWVSDQSTARDWICGMLKYPLSYLDVPVLGRLHDAWSRGDSCSVEHWNAQLYASRESAELQQEDRHLGTALARLLSDLGVAEAETWCTRHAVCFATPFALAASRWQMTADVAATGYLWSWAENQVTVAIKAIPLGQTAGQRLLGDAIVEIAAATRHGLTLRDEEIGFAAAGLGLASALHETQYSRLFRS